MATVNYFYTDPEFDYTLKTLTSLPYRIKHLIFDVSDVLVSKNEKQKMLKAENEKLPYLPPTWYLKLIQTLKPRYTLGVLSNTSVPDLYEKYMRFKDYFNPRVYALKEGIPKPLPEIYELYLTRLKEVNPKLKPRNIAIIDDKTTNLLVPKKLGMFTIHIKRPDTIVSKVHEPYIDLTIDYWPTFREE